MKMKTIFLFLFILFVLPSLAFADTWEYITYGGYDAAVNAWKRTALIFSDNAYKGLFLSVIVLGALAIFISTYVRIASGARSSPIGWTAPVLMGVAIYAAFIIPKDSINVYDEKLNRGPYRIDNIPKIIAISAGILNKIEKGFIEIVSTSSDPTSDYRLNSGGTGWQLLESVKGNGILQPSAEATLQNFIKDCVVTELSRSGTILSIDKIAKGEQKFNDIINQSKNPAIYTVVYPINGSAEGVPKTCEQAANDVLNALSDSTQINNYINSLCKGSGYTSAAGLSQCKNLMSSVLTTVWTSGSGNLGIFTAQKAMAEVFQSVLQNSSVNVAISTLAAAQTQSSFIGLGVHANSWIPVLKESLTAVAISIAPVILLFAATPLAGRALSLTVGMFVWLALWGTIDAIIHSFGVDLAQQYSETIRTIGGDMGLTSMLLFPSYTAKVAATFGALRWSGLMLASVISGMLIKFGGTALAMLAGSISGMPQSSGAAYGGSVLRNAGGVLQSEILPTQTWANAAIATGGVNNLARGLTQYGAGQMAGNAMTGNYFGTERIAHATAAGSIKNISHNSQYDLRTAELLGIRSGQAELADSQQKHGHGGYNYSMMVKSGIISPLNEQELRRQGYSDKEIEEIREAYSAQQIQSLMSRGINIQSDIYGGTARIKGAGASMLVTKDGNAYFDEFDNIGIKSSLEKAIQRRSTINAFFETDVGKRFAHGLSKDLWEGKSGSFSQEISNAFKESTTHSLSKALNENKALKSALGFKETDEFFVQLSGGASGSLGIMAAGTGAKVGIDLKTGIARRYNAEGTVTNEWNLGKQLTETLNQIAEKSKGEAIKNVFSTDSGYKEFERYAQEQKGGFEKAFRESWEKTQSVTQNWGEDYTAAVVNKYIQGKYGKVNIETVSKAIEDFSKMKTIGGYEDFYKYSNISDIKPEEIEKKLSQIRNEVYSEFNSLSGKVKQNTSGNVSGDPYSAWNSIVEQPTNNLDEKVKQFNNKYNKAEEKQNEYFKEKARLNNGGIFSKKAEREVNLQKDLKKRLPQTFGDE